ncbi:hypothetical protein C8Q77DRAFT_1128634 [Trametes polyzona]|nr:hypothetical protein C8Q77DRAFT_1128634 [Trametes polyzona]
MLMPPVAHEMALTNAQIMHRDVSGGNILIYPRVDPTTPEVYWSGMLADCELSKPVSQQGERPRARQPERTGTWQFMSVAILNDHRKVVETSDELESFFHVLLYYAVRYLRSNCTSAGVFIEDFFDSYNYEHGEYSSGSLKQNVMTGNMKLMTSGKTPGPLKFVSTPLNTVIHTILSWFNAFYAKKAFDADEKRRLRVLKSLHSPPNVEAPRKIRYAIPQSTAPILKVQAPEEDEGPSMMNDKLATSASLHAHMRLALLEAISSTGWLEDRVEGDNVPANFEPRRPPGPSNAGRKMPAKKLKAGPQTDGAILSRRGAGSMTPSTPPRKWGTYF